jgi:hypothetical protein
MLGTFKEVIGDEDMSTMVEIWKDEGKVETGRNMILTVLRARFNNVPKDTEQMVLSLSDPIALESWAAQAATCRSVEEFAEALRR